jgi:hypothetical protein
MADWAKQRHGLAGDLRRDQAQSKTTTAKRNETALRESNGDEVQRE